MTTDDGMDVVVTETPSATIARQAAEIERLSLALANAKISFDAIDATLAERDAEIERLRGELEDQRKDTVCDEQRVADLMADVQRLGAENERLRDEIKRLRERLRYQEDRESWAGSHSSQCWSWGPSHYECALREIERLCAEASQLRQAVGALTTLHPTMEIDVNNPVQMALEIVSYVTESRDAEVKRLREENSTFSDSLAAKADRIDRLGETAARQVAEIERLRAQLAATEAGAVSFRDTAEAEFTKLRGTLREIRIRLHAAGRRPEECYEMSLIDEALGGKP